MDPSSLSNPSEAKVDSLHLVLTVDFAKSCLAGYVDVVATLQNDQVSELKLDSNHLNVTGVTDLSNQPIKYHLAAKHEIFGTAIVIEVPQEQRGANKTFTARVHYSTTVESTALQWLSKEQTAGKQHPYLFSQCQAIHARSLVPCQDSPSNKVKYSAEITVPAPLTALMSASSTGKKVDGDKITYTFDQDIAIPTYLIAIVVGHLESREIGPRTMVWSEPEMVDSGAYEFANTEKFIQTGESLLTPYIWKRYDILLLPPSFPYGGMENPMLVFVTPTLLAGDRSLENVIAHEIAHSWCGNLVTNRFWSEFFLNEGFTVFVERKIIGRLYGEDMFQFEAINGLKHLKDDIDQFGATNPLTALRPNLDGIDPDDAFSSVPYDKGFNLLCYLQSLVGVTEFEAWLKSYIAHFAYQSITAEQMKNYFINYFTEKGMADAIAVVDWQSWFNNPGMPHNQVAFTCQLAEQAKELAKKWIATKGDGIESASDFQAFNSQQTILFLDTLLVLTANDHLPVDAIEKMDKLYHLTETRNAEYRAKWYSLCLQSGITRIQPLVAKFLVEQGRMKFVRPLYRELNKVNRELAVSTFTTHRNFYHNICSKMVAKDLGL
ncbi:leukotriene A4 hydrolase [Heterostelium album PN500]|uniref:Leukotriene A4 hydrolase n=1 Tax=Heterostelium pallidum (strain ATCC 26659 / Pp 5 / PN500) TaxID=670386 RepID=D3BR30_HETP5|nr:leukotriene A4 hydrolase [Heterostelium album PN500]EFA75862.1 leukotriene A4 hydrolase [Heterostelium album PN500]|eukprot:XP_020427996.1 leukotriene A4 hydrolase [Heterostelium album PN500]